MQCVEARRIAANLAKLPELLGKNWRSNSKAADKEEQADGFALSLPDGALQVPILENASSGLVEPAGEFVRQTTALSPTEEG
jgi:hypothetical protein